jgi:N-acetylneuraminic acid mutarotase
MKSRLQFAFLALMPLIVLIFAVQSVTRIHAVDSNCQISLGEWKTGASIPYAHIEGATAVVNNKLYIFSGFKDSSLNVSNRVDVYNPATNKWETATNSLRSMPVSLSHAQAVVDGNWVWIAGGFVGKNPGAATNKVYKYNTTTDQWYAGPALPSARAGGAFVKVGRDLHYIGGLSHDRDTDYSNHWVLNLDNTSAGWKTVSTMPTKRNQTGALVIGSQIYIAGGQFKHDHSPKDVNPLHVFNTTTKTWSQKASLPFGRSHNEPGTVNIEGRIVLVGGRANQKGWGYGQIVNVTEYNPAKNAWRELRQLPSKLIASNAAYIDGKLIVAAGGKSYNTANKTTYISQVSFTNCG